LDPAILLSGKKHSKVKTVPFAAWALANWAMASDTNRSHIQELDRDGQVVMTALMAPERTVKWHGSLVARLLLERHCDMLTM
jgi:hypothetical protein